MEGRTGLSGRRPGTAGQRRHGRQQQYEKFYAGASFIVRGHSFREAPWDTFDAVVDGILNSYDVPAPKGDDCKPADRLDASSSAGDG